MNAYDGINNAWKSACKIILGDEIGDLKDYADYLKRYNEPVIMRKSAITGKDVPVSSDRICKTAKIVSMEEIEEYLRMTKDFKLDINSIKDIDSLLEMCKEQFYYAGNVYLGTSSNVIESDRCIDSSFVYRSHEILENCKYVAFSTRTMGSEYNFGVTHGGKSKFIIRGYNPYITTRCMEILRTYDSSDIYFSANLENCQNCMFSFNLRSRNYTIGNLQLTNEKYSELKKKLLEEMREKLRKKKELPTLLEMISQGKNEQKDVTVYEGDEQKTEIVEKISDAFGTTSALIFGKKLEGRFNDYEKWLTKYTGKIVTVKSAISDRLVYVSPIEIYLAIKDNSVTFEEALGLGKKSIAEDEAEKLCIDNAGKILATIKSTTPEDKYGKNYDVVNCASYGNCGRIYKLHFCYDTKNGAFCFWSKYAEDVFGCSFLFNSKYCINCHSSTYLTRCFEVTNSKNCSDCYFCHNCESLSNCMFCFNTKSKRYAIANIELGQEKYNEIKKMIMNKLANQIENDKGTDIDIYNMQRCKKKCNATSKPH